MTPRACVYMLAKLRKAAHRLTNDTAQEEEVRRGVICLVAYTVELGREILASTSQPAAGWLLLRTLWHNTGCLAWLLTDPVVLVPELVDLRMTTIFGRSKPL